MARPRNGICGRGQAGAAPSPLRWIPVWWLGLLNSVGGERARCVTPLRALDPRTKKQLGPRLPRDCFGAAVWQGAGQHRAVRKLARRSLPCPQAQGRARASPPSSAAHQLRGLQLREGISCAPGQRQSRGTGQGADERRSDARFRGRRKAVRFRRERTRPLCQRAEHRHM